MKIQGKFYFLFLVLLLINYGLNAAELIKIEEGQETIIFKGKHLEILEDVDNTLSFDEVKNPVYNKQFKTPDLGIPTNENLNSTYWVRFRIDSLPSDYYWILELYDFSIDSFQLYIPERGKYYMESGGDHFAFQKKYFWHKNFIYELPVTMDSPGTIYLRIKSNDYVGFVGAIRSFKKFSGYALSEYYLLALFYGIVVAMALYNFFLFITVRDVAYFFYITLIISIAIFSLCHDGLAFQFLWPDNPGYNGMALSVATTIMTVAALLHTIFFLPVKSKADSFFYLLIGALVLRLIIFAAGGLPMGGSYIPNLERIFFSIPLVTGIYVYSIGYGPARFFIVGYSILYFTFFLTFLEEIGIIQGQALTLYSTNFGVISLILFLSIALADRIKLLVAEKEKADNALISQLKEKELLKDRVNQELELMVEERTKELVEKNKQLDTFVYKASHDIKGPLRSIMGLTTVGIKDVSDPDTKKAFENILKSTNGLDSMLTNLLSMTKVREAKLEIVKIDFAKVIKEVLCTYESLNDFKKIRFDINVKVNIDFFSDEKILSSIFKHLIDNSIKYRDFSKQEFKISISVETTESEANLTVEDNGIGIREDSINKIFEVFYKDSELSKGSGLGLPLVKIAVEKLGGSIRVKSKVQHGSTFTINIPQSK